MSIYLDKRWALAVALLLVFHAGLLAWVAYRTSPNCDEVGHLPAGLYVWEFGRFDLYRVNPPLVRTWAALPVVLSEPKGAWDWYQIGPITRPEWRIGQDFIAANGLESFWYFTRARWALIPLALLGALVCYCWATELYGRMAGLLALALWCFSPNVIAWGATITPDLGASALGVTAAWCYWRWLRQPMWSRAVMAGLTLGLAELTKTTWIVLFGLWPALWLVWRWSQPQSIQSRLNRPPAIQLAVVLLLGVYLVNVGFMFEGSFKRLGDYTFVSQALTADQAVSQLGTGGNRFSETWLAAVPVPLPEHYVGGIDLQKRDFEQGMSSYLRGEWRHGGWWYYYIYVAVIKVPLGTWMLALLAIGLRVWSFKAVGAAEARETGKRPAYEAPKFPTHWRNELVLLAPAVVVLLLVSSQTGFSRYFRYVLPCFPFVFILISQIARSIELKGRLVSLLATAALVWSICSSLWIYPHSLSYFNELVGGPNNGHYHVVDSNIDWGQDMLYLMAWLNDHPSARPLHLAHFCFVDPQHFGIDFQSPPHGPVAGQNDGEAETAGKVGPLPGWYAISVHRIHSRTHQYEYFLHFEPVATAGYSIYIYHITSVEANRARRELGLSELSRW